MARMEIMRRVEISGGLIAARALNAYSIISKRRIQSYAVMELED